LLARLGIDAFIFDSENVFSRRTIQPRNSELPLNWNRLTKNRIAIGMPEENHA
jgi:hypothetical protein